MAYEFWLSGGNTNKDSDAPTTHRYGCQRCAPAAAKRISTVRAGAHPSINGPASLSTASRDHRKCALCVRTVGGVDELISQALSNGLDVAESGVAGTGGDQVDRLQKQRRREGENRLELCKQNAPRDRLASGAVPRTRNSGRHPSLPPPANPPARTWLTRRRGDTSTAWRRTTPLEPMRVESSRGPLLATASATICRGLAPVTRWMISMVCWNKD